MTETDIRKAIFEAIGKIAPEADASQLNPNENLREALDIDSFDFLNVLIGIHERLGVEIPESDYGRVGTLSDLVRYLGGKTK